MKRSYMVKGLFIAAALALSPLSFAAKAGKVDVIVGYDAKPGQAEQNRIKSLGGETKLGFFTKRRLTDPVEDLAKDARRRLKTTLGQLGSHDAERFAKQLGPGMGNDELLQLAAGVERLRTALGTVDG